MSEIKEWWISKGTSNFCSELIHDEDLDILVKNCPDGFYDIVSNEDTIENGIHVIKYSEYEKFKNAIIRAISDIRHGKREYEIELVEYLCEILNE